jgi:protein subunit release factor B
MNTDYPQPFRFTPENARENAAKSWQARRERKAKLEAEAQQGRQSSPQSERLALQIERVERMMEKTTDADTLVKLTAAHTRMFKTWQVLTETPNPGSWRGKRRPRPAPPTIEHVTQEPPSAT